MGDSDTSRFSELSYRLRVRDFGPIAEADVTLRPLTVFVGPSNTGKSYLATLIYALHRCFVDRGSLPDPPDRSAPIPHVRDLRRLGEWAMGIAGPKTSATWAAAPRPRSPRTRPLVCLIFRQIWIHLCVPFLRRHPE